MCHSKIQCLLSRRYFQKRNLIGSQIDHKLHKKISHKDITILYHAHYVTRTLEETLLKIPYSIYSGIQFLSMIEWK